MSTASQLQQLYVAYFGRAADPAGLDYWVAQGTTSKAFAAHMHGQDEFQSVYGTKSTEAQVNQIYQNLFNRDADAAGLLYWTKQVETGALALASIANDLIWNVENGHGSATDKSTLTAKSTTADAFTAEIRLSADAILAYQPDSTSPWKAGEDFATAVTFMNTATSTNTPTSAQITTSVTGITAADTGATGSSYTLVASKDESLLGTDDNDTFYALTAGNLNGSDVVDGGKGTDKIVATVATAAATLRPILKNMETANIELSQGTAGTAHTLTLDFQDSTGLKTVDVENISATNGSEDTVAIKGISTDVAVEISDENASGNLDNNFTVTYDAITGTSDSATVTMSSTSAATTFGTLTVAGIETLTVDSTGGTDATYTVTAADATTLNIKASAASGGTVTTGAAKATTLNITSADDITVDDAGAASAKLTSVVIDSTTANKTVTAINLTPTDSTTAIDTWTITTKGVGKVVADFDGDWGAQSDTNADVFKVDASANSGGTTIDFSDYTNNNARYNTFTGGSGNDNAIVLKGTLDQYDTFNLGDGTEDVITTTATLTADVTSVFYTDTALSTAKPTISGVEIAAINLNGADDARTVSVGSADFASTICLLDDIDDEVTTIDSIKVGSTIKLGKTLDLTHATSALVLTQLAATSTAPSASLAITSDLLENAASATNATIDDLRVDTTSAVNLTLASSDTDVVKVIVNDLSANKASSVTVTSSEKVTFTDIDAADDATLDFTGVTGELSVTADTANDYTIKGSSTAKSTIIMTTGLDADDVITGGSHATDKLTFTANGQTATTGKLNISGIEEIHALTTAATTIDATSISGGTIRVFGDGTNGGDSSASITFTNLAADSTIGIGSNTNGTNDTYGATVATTLTVGLKDATGSSDAITFELGARGENDDIDTLLASTGIETVTIKDSATAKDAQLGVAGLTATKIIVTGGLAGEEVDLTDGGSSTLSSSTTTVDASAFKGALDVDASADIPTTVTALAAVTRITGSTGADTVTIGSSTSHLGASVGDVDLGGGSDTITAYLKDSGSLAAVDTVETINIVVGELTGTTSTITIGAATHGIVDATALNITGGLAGNVTTLSYAVPDGTKTIDASAYLGSIGLTYGNDGLVQSNTSDPIILKGSTAGTADILTAHASATATGEVTISGFETMVLGSSAGANTLDMKNITGLTNLAITSGGGADDDLTINNASISTVDIGTTGVDFTGKTIDYNLTAITGSSDAVTFNLVNMVEIDVDTDGIETVNIVAKAGESSTATETVGIAASTVTNGTVNVSGADADDEVTLDAIASGYTTVSATGLAGDLTIALAARASSAMTITGGTGSDSIAMENASDVLDGGTTTGTTDTLVLGGTYNSGGITVDLTQSGDQITLFNGAANATVQKGFESVDLEAASFGGVGATITGTTAAQTIKGTNQADTINPGAGIDSVYPGAGADTITITETTQAVDTIVLANIANIKSTVDTVTGFVSGDLIHLAATASGQFGDFNNATTTGVAFDGATTAVPVAVNIAGGDVAVATTSNVFSWNANTASLSTGYAGFSALSTGLNAVAAITTAGGADWAAGDELLSVFYNTSESAYEVGILTVVGNDGIDGGDDTWEALLRVDSTGVTQAEVAAAIRFIA